MKLLINIKPESLSLCYPLKFSEKYQTDSLFIISKIHQDIHSEMVINFPYDPYELGLKLEPRGRGGGGGQSREVHLN